MNYYYYKYCVVGFVDKELLKNVIDIFSFGEEDVVDGGVKDV